ncbi:MAG: DNA repair protein RadA [Alphaproteobacteria bacterium]|jgi:DNA repair protein RadA/Sms|nr:DNA repair protein RadA [Alphaproteobacteria bacterium]
MAKKSTVFICSNCNATFPKWSGQCDNCGSWNTIEESSSHSSPQFSKNSITPNKIVFANLAEEIQIIPRFLSNIKEFDRVCGGGLVLGSAILVGGDPGIGKSTLLMQVIANLSKQHSCVYISGEESIDQLKRRALRLDVIHDNLKIATHTSLVDILYSLETIKPEVLIIDSIQTMYLESVSGIPGSVSQVRSTANELINFCKKQNITVIMIGHVTREGQIAGPKVLEHMVDSVLYFEGEKNNNFRILRAVKNRFGATDEIGIFEMGEKGLIEVDNPSALFLHDYLTNISGTSVFAGIEGLRPILVEVQSLLVPTVFASPRRAVVGADMNRLSMITAVLESRCGILFSNKDIYLNIAGGLKITEPALDLAIGASIISSFLEIVLPKKTVFFGEISLSGQIRTTSHIEKRLLETMRLGFEKAIIPKISAKQKKLIKPEIFDNLEIIEINNIVDLIRILKKQ